MWRTLVLFVLHGQCKSRMQAEGMHLRNGFRYTGVIYLVNSSVLSTTSLKVCTSIGGEAARVGLQCGVRQIEVKR